jgi:hypothetical protein
MHTIGIIPVALTTSAKHAEDTIMVMPLGMLHCSCHTEHTYHASCEAAISKKSCTKAMAHSAPTDHASMMHLQP